MSEVNPNRSNLDQQQIFQRAFNEDLDRIRVDAQISASIIAPPGLEVSITSVDDSILIVGTEDATTTGTQHVVKVNSDGSLDVNAAVTLPANSSVNLNQIAGTAAAVNNGTANAGTLRVAIASDNSPISVTQSTSPWVVSGTVATTQSGTWVLGPNNGVDIGDVTVNNADTNPVPVKMMSKLVPETHDELILTRDPLTFVITEIEYKLLGATVATVIIERDIYLNIIRVYRA